MPAIDRLIAAGMAPGMAFDTVYCFLMHGRSDGMERYICKIERSGMEREIDA